jgi:hypothetical protein
LIRHTSGLRDQWELLAMAGWRLDDVITTKAFAFVYIPVRSFMHLFTLADQLACLHRVYAHLRPSEQFILDLYAPSFPLLAQVPDRPFVVRRAFDLPNGHQVIRKDHFVRNDLVNQIHYSELRFEEYDRTGSLVHERLVPLQTRCTFRYELQLLLERVGFEVIAFFGDYDQKPYDGTGEIIAVAVLSVWRRTRTMWQGKKSHHPVSAPRLTPAWPP